MSQVIVMHRAYANPRGDWYPWLKETLEERGIPVHVPAFPSHRSPRLLTWLATCAKALSQADQKTVIVVHDIAFIVALRTIQVRMPDLRLKGMLAVAGQCGPVDNFGLLNHFFSSSIDWALLRSALGKVSVLQDENDPLAPLSHGQSIAQELAADLVITRGRGHFSGSTLPEAIEAINLILA